MALVGLQVHRLPGFTTTSKMWTPSLVFHLICRKRLSIGAFTKRSQWDLFSQDPCCGLTKGALIPLNFTGASLTWHEPTYQYLTCRKCLSIGAFTKPPLHSHAVRTAIDQAIRLDPFWNCILWVFKLQHNCTTATTGILLLQSAFCVRRRNMMHSSLSPNTTKTGCTRSNLNPHFIQFNAKENIEGVAAWSRESRWRQQKLFLLRPR